MSVTLNFARHLLCSTLIITLATSAYAAPPFGGGSFSGAARSMSSGLSRSMQQSARSLPSGNFGSSQRMGNFKPNTGKIAPKIASPSFQRPQVQQLQKHLGNKLSPIVNGNKVAPKVGLPGNLSNKLNPSIVNKSPILTKVGPKFTPIVANPPKPVHCLPPCFPHPHHHHHSSLPWYLTGVGIGLASGYGNGGYGGGYVAPCEPVVIQVCPPAPVQVPAPQPMPVPGQDQVPAVPAEESAVPAEATAESRSSQEPPASEVTQKLPQVRVGALVDLQGRDFGDDLGGVTLKVNDVELGCLVNEWKDNGVKATLPTVGVSGPTKAMLSIVLRDGDVAQSIEVELLPASQPGPIVASSTVP